MLVTLASGVWIYSGPRPCRSRRPHEWPHGRHHDTNVQRGLGWPRVCRRAVGAGSASASGFNSTGSLSLRWPLDAVGICL